MTDLSLCFSPTNLGVASVFSMVDSGLGGVAGLKGEINGRGGGPFELGKMVNYYRVVEVAEAAKFGKLRK